MSVWSLVQSVSWSSVAKMGCVCARETLHVKGNKFRIIERIAEG
jgi:hypothetical protein